MDNYIVTFEYRVMVTAFAIFAMFRLLGFELFSIAEESKQKVYNGAKPAKRNSLREKEEEVSDELGEEDGLEDAESGESEESSDKAEDNASESQDKSDGEDQ